MVLDIDFLLWVCWEHYSLYKISICYPVFFTNNTSAVAVDKLSLIKIFPKYLSMFFFIALVFCSDNNL